MSNEIARFELFFSDVTERIDKAQTTDEVIAIRTEACILAAAARAAKDREYEDRAIDIKRQTERRLGQLMAAQRDAGLMNKGGGDQKSDHRGTTSPADQPSLAQVGIDKDLAKAARRAYPEGWMAKPKRKKLTPEELAAIGRSPGTERYHTPSGGTATRIKLINDDLAAARQRIDELEQENARLRRDLEALQRGDVFGLSAAAMAQRKAIVAKSKAQREHETVPDERTKEAFEREIKGLKAQLRNEKSKVLAFVANGKTVLDKDDRKAILVCLHPDGATDENEKARREKAFKLFSGAVPEPVF